jgi:uncharacterized membrane protein
VAGRGTARNDAIDWLRGVVMIVMALDHARMFLGTPVDLATAPTALYFTRWVTHFCAPVFVLLAGMAAWLHGRRLGSTAALAGYLVTRGLWLVLLEVTVVRFVWTFALGPDHLFLQVIWAIGGAMVGLAALVWLPRAAIAAVAVVLVAAHNLLDGVHAGAFGSLRWLWLLLHQPGSLAPFEGARWFIAYPLLPWLGVMASGYVLGAWVLETRDVRRRRFFTLGLALTAGFVVLRALNRYGDPQPWVVGASPLRTVLAFLDCEKYPPSLLFLAMTIGPALCLLAAMDRPLGAVARPVVVFGRVPLFYYVLHLLLLHMMAVLVAWPADGAGALARSFGSQPLGLPLPAVYACWVAAVVLLYPACRWFAGVKRRSTSPIMSYL